MSKATKSEKIKFVLEVLKRISDVCVEGIESGHDKDAHPWEVIQTTMMLVYEQDLALSILMNAEMLKGKTQEQVADELTESLKGKTDDELISEAIKAMENQELQEHILTKGETVVNNVVEFNKKKGETVH